MSEKFDCSVINHLINQLSPATIKILPLHSNAHTEPTERRSDKLEAILMTGLTACFVAIACLNTTIAIAEEKNGLSWKWNS